MKACAEMKFLKRIWRWLTDKDYRKYTAMRRRQKKELIRLVKTDEVFDYDFLHRLVIAKIRHMLEYYQCGYNVWQTEETLNPLIESLEKAVMLADRIDNVWHEPRWWEKEEELYRELYTHIGENIQRWWD